MDDARQLAKRMFGKQIRDLRISKGMSQSDLSTAAKTGINSVRRLEQGKRFISDETLNDLARGLDVPVTDLLEMRHSCFEYAGVLAEHVQKIEPERSTNGDRDGNADLEATWEIATKLFGKRLLELREQCGISQRDVTKRVGINNTLVGKYEQGLVLPKVQTLAYLAEGLGLTFGKMLKHVEECYQMALSQEKR